jgi:hypothetical protein
VQTNSSIHDSTSNYENHLHKNKIQTFKTLLTKINLTTFVQDYQILMMKAFYLEQNKCNKQQTPNFVSMKIQFEKHQLPN